jgi:hypothetical protein
MFEAVCEEVWWASVRMGWDVELCLWAYTVPSGIHETSIV